MNEVNEQSVAEGVQGPGTVQRNDSHTASTASATLGEPALGEDIMVQWLDSPARSTPTKPTKGTSIGGAWIHTGGSFPRSVGGARPTAEAEVPSAPPNGVASCAVVSSICQPLSTGCRRTGHQYLLLYKISSESSFIGSWWRHGQRGEFGRSPGWPTGLMSIRASSSH
ncbi:hypothetical protein THAOC_21906 [Thalassiosira oceanica]|uniref:Uncharacterized protein n=1 Tax=Thalassiosira oceanica TaxID=159749 RepID=K0RYB0_THAOC|nr:hypothetical protein THAOC_21906 [Thalassiosira oceanica]|eukprot:EJK58005.1 hypothetical protein THAOC_21906 [Thalassiosira oceanica]